MSNIGQTKTEPISFASSGDNTVVQGVAGKIITVVRLYLVVGGATAITFKDGANTLLSGAMSLTANGSIVFDSYQNLPWFATSGNFVINNSNAVQVSGEVYYVQE